jgi:hypothetical protein
VELPLEPVLRPREVAQIGGGLARGDRAEVVLAEAVALTDQPVLVRIDDPASGRPDLHAHDVALEDAPVHDAVDPRDRTSVAAHQRRRQGRLDGAAPGHLRYLGGVADRLRPAGVAQDVDARRAEQDQRGEAAEREARDDAADAVRVVRTLLIGPHNTPYTWNHPYGFNSLHSKSLQNKISRRNWTLVVRPMSSCRCDRSECRLDGVSPSPNRKGATHMTRGLIATVAVGAAVLITAAAGLGKNTVTTIRATVGPGSIISVTKNGLPVKSLRSGAYRLVISDRSAEHNFVLRRGSAIRQLTSVRFIGTKTVNVALARGTWRFDDRGAGREAEPGDDRGAGREAEPGDDRGGRHGGQDG